MRKNFIWKRLLVMVLVLSMGVSLSYIPFYAEAQEVEGEEVPLEEIVSGLESTSTSLSPKLIDASVIEKTINVPGSLQMEMEIESQIGISQFQLNFSYKLSNGAIAYNWLQSGHHGSPLTTGTHIISFGMDESFPATEYSITCLMLTDSFGSNTQYDVLPESDYMIDRYSDPVIHQGFPFDANFTVLNSPNVDITAPKINGMEIITKSIKAPGILEVEVDITEEDSGVRMIGLTVPYKNRSSANPKRLFWDSGDGEPLKTGIHTISFMIDEKFPLADYYIRDVEMYDATNLYVCYEIGKDYNGENLDYLYNRSDGLNEASRDSFASDTTFDIYESPITDIVAPKIDSAGIITNMTVTPGLLQVEMDITEEDSGVIMIHLWFAPEGSYKTRYLTWQDESNPLTTGKHILSFPLGPAVMTGNYDIEGFNLYDSANNVGSYSRWHYGTGPNADQGPNFLYNNDIGARGHEGEGAFLFEGGFTVENNLDISLITANGTADLVENLEEMEEGEVAVVDYSNDSHVPKKLFGAIAGKNKSIIFQNDEFQWIFNGKDISIEDCKDIDLSVHISNEPGSHYGYSEETVSVVHFPNNGKLPGKAEVRAYTEYMLAKSGKGNSLKVTWIENGEPQSETQPATVEGDNYITFPVDHNSTYVLSTTYPDIPFVAQQKGDINNDGKINIQDIMEIRNHIFGKVVLEGDTFLAADIDGDGVVNIRDIMAIRDHIFGKKVIS